MIILLVRWIHPAQHIAVMRAVSQHWHQWSGGSPCVLHLCPKRLCRSRRMCDEEGFEIDGLCGKGERECRATVALGFECATELLG